MNTSQTRSTMALEGVSTGDVSTIGMRSDPRSPMSVGAIGASTLSMRAKAARKRQVNATHNSNFRAGFVPVEEDALHRAGIRGRKRYFLYCVLAGLMIVAVLNMAITALLLYILGMTHNGLTSLEMTMIQGRDFLRVLDKASIYTMSMVDAPLGATYDNNLSIEAPNAKLEVKVRNSSKRKASVILEKNVITVVTNNFSVKTSNATDWFSTNLASLTAHDLILNLSADQVTAKKISSRQDYKDLSLESVRGVNILATEDLAISSLKTIDIQAQTVNIISQSSTTIKTSHGMFLGKELPKVNTSNAADYKNLTYKLCVCASGRVFKVRVNKPGITCLDVDLGQLQKLCGNSV
uniref:Beta-sarcoglycan n=1 Tax=Biomphalaria glabrata TaxID=6526 RepID=A0A2C9LE39_BIOGL